MIIRHYQNSPDSFRCQHCQELNLQRPLQQPDVVVPQPLLTARVWPSINTPSVRIKQKRKEHTSRPSLPSPSLVDVVGVEHDRATGGGGGPTYRDHAISSESSPWWSFMFVNKHQYSHNHKRYDRKNLTEGSRRVSSRSLVYPKQLSICRQINLK